MLPAIPLLVGMGIDELEHGARFCSGSKRDYQSF